MEITVAAVCGAVVSLLIFAMRILLMWGLSKKALELGASLKISGINPLAPTIEIYSDLDPRQHKTPKYGNNNLAEIRTRSRRTAA